MDSDNLLGLLIDHQQVEKAKQDDTLDDLSNLLGDLKNMALDMGSEIERLVEPLLSEVSEIARYGINLLYIVLLCIFCSSYVTQTHLSSFCIHWCLSYFTQTHLPSLPFSDILTLTLPNTHSHLDERL